MRRTRRSSVPNKWPKCFSRSGQICGASRTWIIVSQVGGRTAEMDSDLIMRSARRTGDKDKQIRAEYVTHINDQCVTHPYRSHDGCEKQALSDHSMLVVDIN